MEDEAHDDEIEPAAPGPLRSALRSPAAHAADKVTLQLKWVTQAQFAGYYVAKAKGYYKEADLDVTINPGGPDVAPPQVIAGGGADVVIDWMPSALASREKGVPLVNIAQPFKTIRPAAHLPRRHRHQDAGRPQGQDARRLVLRQRVSVPVLDVEARLQDRRLGRRREGAQAGLQRRSAAAEAGRLHLDHDLQRVLAGDRRRLQARASSWSSSTRTRAWRRWRTASMCMEAKLKDPAFVATMAKFVKASMKGWDYARKNPDEAAKIVLANDTTGAQTEKHQKRMMGEIAKLLDDRQRQARSQGLRAHRRDAADRRLRSGDHQEARRRLEPRGV